MRRPIFARRAFIAISLTLSAWCFPVLTAAEDIVTLTDQAKIQYQQGHYIEAIRLAELAVGIAERRLPSADRDSFRAYLVLGLAYAGAGDPEQAITHSSRAIDCAEKQSGLGPRYPGLGVALTNLADSLCELGRLPQAEDTARRAIDLSERNPDFGPSHQQTAVAKECLARVLTRRGDYVGADELYRDSRAVKQRLFGEDSPQVATSLELSAGIHYITRRFDQSEVLYRQALAIYEKKLGPRHPDTALAYNNYARLCFAKGDYQKATALQVKARDLLSVILAKDHPLQARMDNNLGELLAATGRLADSVPHFSAAIDSRIKRFGVTHPQSSTSLQNLVFALAGQSDWLNAASIADKARRGVRSYVARVLPSLSDREQIQFLKVQDEKNLNSALSIGLARPDDEQIASMSAGWLANAKSVGQEATAERILVARESGDPAAARTADELATVRRQLAAYRQALSSSTDGGDVLSKIGELEEKERSLIRSLGIAMPWADKDDPWVAIEDIRRAIPAGSVFVDIARFSVRDFSDVAREGTPFDPFKPARYAAWILPPAGVGAVRVIDLGEADRIDGLVDALRTLLTAESRPQGAITEKGESAAEGEYVATTAPLSQSTIQPILRAATEAIGEAPEEIILCADGKLWLVPFAGLLLDDGRYVVENLAIRLVTSGRDLVDPAAAERRDAAVGKPLIMAAPDFDNASPGKVVNPAPGTRGVGPSVRLPTGRRLEAMPLPGTLSEAKIEAPMIQQLTGSAPEVVTGGDATEARFKSAQRPQIVVLATHGFFRPDQQIDPKLLATMQGGEGAARGIADSRGEALENPLTRCGLLFAGCNRASAADAAAGTAEDGVLTGLEIVGCDLRGTKLVILSACQTGEGDVSAGQGVAGLRQAFQLAGAETVASTLWSIPDEDTARLMKDFVQGITDGSRPSIALRDAQRKFIAERRDLKDTAHPYFWAAFTVTERN